jgi:LeuA allosteric (dimerisation) domain
MGAQAGDRARVGIHAPSMHRQGDVAGLVRAAMIDHVTKRPPGNLELIRRVLGNDYLNLEVKHLTLEEDSETGKSLVKIETVQNGTSQVTVEGEGVGLVDALIAGLFKRYEIEYQSLKSIELAGFHVHARLDTKKRRAGADSVGEVTLEVRNSDGKLFVFSDSSRSIATSTARAVIAAVEYFVNAERAFITLYKSRQDARERNRDDLVTRYTEELSEVVKSTSYAEVIDGIKAEVIDGIKKESDE